MLVRVHALSHRLLIPFFFWLSPSYTPSYNIANNIPTKFNTLKHDQTNWHHQLTYQNPIFTQSVGISSKKGSKHEQQQQGKRKKWEWETYWVISARERTLAGRRLEQIQERSGRASWTWNGHSKLSGLNASCPSNPSSPSSAHSRRALIPPPPPPPPSPSSSSSSVECHRLWRSATPPAATGAAVISSVSVGRSNGRSIRDLFFF